jgi:hypothetical protein
VPGAYAWVGDVRAMKPADMMSKIAGAMRSLRTMSLLLLSCCEIAVG